MEENKVKEKWMLPEILRGLKLARRQKLQCNCAGRNVRRYKTSDVAVGMPLDTETGMQLPW